MKIYSSVALLFGAILAAKAGQAVITSGPKDLTINAGSTADFIVTATNAKTYQWTFQGANIPGATKSEYKIDNTGANQAGVYSVIVRSTGTNLTNSATLDVIQGTIVNFQISGFPTGPSNLVVELFDHDKPVTVENFLHYVTSGAYSNMFFDRLIPGFVLQGGGWAAQDRTNAAPIPVVDDIASLYIYSFHFNPPLPFAIDSEFYVGPKVSNTKGTIAMALPPGYVNAASDAFFFNLVDNTNLDAFKNGGGPFTVFGRVLSGTNVLQYFNNPKAFSKPAVTRLPTRKVLTTNLVTVTNFTTNGLSGVVTTNVVNTNIVTAAFFPINLFTNGILNYSLLASNAPSFTDLPVNYHGTNLPANSNFFFVDFTFPDANAQPVLDTTQPTAAITFPLSGTVLTNGFALTVLGTASDNVGLAHAFIALRTFINGVYGNPLAEFVNFNPPGGTNWSAFYGVLPPGVYNGFVQPQDGAGNEANQYAVPNIVITAVVTSGVGAVSATNLSSGAVLSDAVGANLAVGTPYALGAQPGPDQLFVNWTSGTNLTINPNITIQFTGNQFVTSTNFSARTVSNRFVTANFISNTLPGGIAFTYPPLGGNTTNGNFSIRGAINGLPNTPITLNCRLFSYASQLPAGPVLQTTATNNWSFLVTNLPLGHYFVQVIAQDAAGQTTLITNDFTAGLLMTVLTNGNGRGAITTNFNGRFLVEGQPYSMKAAAAAGSLFDTWSDGVHYTYSPMVSFRMKPGLVLTATFVSNDIPGPSALAFAYPTNGAKLTTNSFNLTGTISSTVTNPVVGYQLFYGSNSLTPPSTNVSFLPGTNLARLTWSVGLTNLAPGYYTVVATASDFKGRSTLISESFQVLAQVLLQINPAGYGAISSNAANWTGQFISVGVPCSLTAKTNGGYVFAFWSNNLTRGLNRNNPLTLAVTNNESLTAHFASNYFFNVAGTYNGLFFPTETNAVISPTNSGYYTLSVTSNAAFNLKLSFPGTNLTISGAFPLYVSDPAGYANLGFYGKGLDGKYVTNILHLDMTNGTYSLFGTVTNAKFSSVLRACLAATRLAGDSPVLPGKYVFSFPGDRAATNNLPGGDSDGAFTLGTNGSIVLGGWLADNTAITPTTSVSTRGTNVVWPFYSSLYSGKGIILGWQTNTSPTNFEGRLVWSKPARTGAYYTNAFLFLTNSSSSSFLPPVRGTRYQIEFGGASLTNGLTNTLTVGANGLFTVDPSQTNKLTLTLTTNGANTGALRGSFSYPSSRSTHNLYGDFVSPSQGGSGYFLDTNSQTGFFEITVLPP